jgi:hypothetical protein
MAGETLHEVSQSNTVYEVNGSKALLEDSWSAQAENVPAFSSQSESKKLEEKGSLPQFDLTDCMGVDEGVQVTDNGTTLSLNDCGQLSAVQYPDGRMIDLHYDDNGEVTHIDVYSADGSQAHPIYNTPVDGVYGITADSKTGEVVVTYGNGTETHSANGVAEGAEAQKK